MKKIISFLTSLSLLSTTSTMIVSCAETYADCFDQNGNNITDKGSDQKQWIDLFGILFMTVSVPRAKVPNATIFQEMNNKSLNDLYENYFNQFKSKWNFNYDFIFLITNYNSINKDVINQMQTNELADKNPGIYLFLNLPTIDINNIENEPEIDFQFLFMIKDISGNIIGNNNNDWFYWYDCNMIRILPNSPEFFLNLKEKVFQKRVITNFYTE